MHDFSPIQNDVRFSAKSRSVPYNYRISYKVSQICVALYICSRRGGCTLTKLHLLSTCLLSKSELRKVVAICNNKADLLLPIIRFDPAVSRALQYAIGDSFIQQQTNGTIMLTDKGLQFADLIMQDDTLMVTEKDILKQISGKLTANRLRLISERMEGFDLC